MDGVKSAGKLQRDLHKFCRDELKTLFLEPADYFAGSRIVTRRSYFVARGVN
jgi:hypothetical protein